MNSDQTRISTILQLLQKTYPQAHIMLTYKTPWELLVAIILSAQCTDVMVNTVTPRLFKAYPMVEDMAYADQTKIETMIKSTGFFHNKAKHIIAAANRILKTFHGVVPQTMEELLTLPGVARKTANVVLANAYAKTSGIAVDTHVIRLSQRLRLVPLHQIGGKQCVFFVKNNKKILDFKKDANPGKIEEELMQILPKHQWIQITYQLIDHGRAICKAQNPLCQTCPLQLFCPSSRSTNTLHS